eukprot:COSAG01_NODE_25240_length_751_cov_1.314417_1_plen_89_part_00
MRRWAWCARAVSSWGVKVLVVTVAQCSAVLLLGAGAGARAAATACSAIAITISGCWLGAPPAARLHYVFFYPPTVITCLRKVTLYNLP